MLRLSDCLFRWRETCSDYDVIDKISGDFVDLFSECDNNF